MEPKKLDLNKWHFFSGRHNSEVYIRNDEKYMVKLFRPGFADSMDDLISEQEIARRVYDLGVATPDVGDIVRVNDGIGLVFENIPNKVSFGRRLKNNPEQAADIGRDLAKLCRGLHAIDCDTEHFPSRAGVLKGFIETCDIIDDDERARVLAFVDSIPEGTKCIHGDLHPGNVIFNENSTYFIDLGMFSYGNPDLDVSILYCFLNLVPPIVKEKVYYGNDATSREIWDSFAKEYYETTDDDELAAIEARMKPLGSLVMFVFHMKRPAPFIRSVLDEHLFPNI